MPQRELMNGMTSHAFAAIVAATVVMFPTPQDLWHTIPPGPTVSEANIVGAGASRVFPVSLSPETTTPDLVAALKYCADDFSGTLSIYTTECLQVMSLSTSRLQNATGDRTARRARESLSLAQALYCRQQWANAQTSQRVFDVAGCLTESPRLAEPV